MTYKIMIVEDEENIRSVVTKYMEKERYEVVEAVDGLRACQLLKKMILI